MFVPRANIQVLNVNSDKRQLEVLKVLKHLACQATVHLNIGHWDIAWQWNKCVYFSTPENDLGREEEWLDVKKKKKSNVGLVFDTATEKDKMNIYKNRGKKKILKERQKCIKTVLKKFLNILKERHNWRAGGEQWHEARSCSRLHTGSIAGWSRISAADGKTRSPVCSLFVPAPEDLFSHQVQTSFPPHAISAFLRFPFD